MPLSWFYGKITNIRNELYEKGALKSFSLGAPTVSIGNITVGGTGKTPLVAFVAEALAAKGEKVCILTRGYGRENPKQRVLVSDGEKVLVDVKAAGDEPFELAQKLLGKASVAADADRVAAAAWARENLGVTAFVLDDAFQHRRAKRDLDIVCVDATNPFGNSKMLPSGILREPLENLKRADVIVITRANLVKDISGLKAEISKYNPDYAVFTAENKVSGLIELEKFPAKARRPQSANDNNQQPASNKQQTTNNEQRTTDNEHPATCKYLAFCALGNPDNFFEQLRSENFDLVSTRKFPDHHFYKQKDIENLEAKAQQIGAEAFITTAKDAVKLKNLRFNLPCIVAESEMQFDDEKKLREIIGAVFNRKSQIANRKS